METLVVAQHRNQYYSRGKPDSPVRFGSSPSRGFRDINCRTFELGAGLLPSPWKLNKSPSSPKVQTPFTKSSLAMIEDAPPSKKFVKSSPIAIDLKGLRKEQPLNDNLCFSELWAGPAYSNSPPPSSLPMPKFSIKPKRTVSLELPASESDVNLRPMAKSAPASPTRGSNRFSDESLRNEDSATKTLRRILNLDITDD